MSKIAEQIAAAMGPNANKNKIKRVTPLGVAVFPHLIAHDDYQLKENNKHECNTMLRLDPNESGVQEFIDDIEAYAQAAFDEGKAGLEAQLAEAKGKKLKDLKEAIAGLEVFKPFEPEYEDNGDEKDTVVFKMKTSVSGVDKKTNKRWTREVPIFDASGAPVKGEARSEMRLWGGSEIKVEVQLIPFCAEGLKKAGVSMRILAVQVIGLQEGGASAESHGFGVEEGGYTAERFDSESTEGSTESAQASDSEEDEDF